VTTLAHSPIGRPMRVVRVAGDDGISIRLMEMGLIAGAAVTVLGQAPFGDPLEVELRGYHLSLRRSEAARVEVESIAGS
jgi:ferrous iron transport protein A